MTKVQIHYRLERPLDPQLMERIASIHTMYGFARVQPSAGQQGLVVDYDASRLTEADVEAVLRRAGIPIVREA